MIVGRAAPQKSELWPGLFRGWAITGVFFEHWFEGVSAFPSVSVLDHVNAAAYRSGCLVQLFFLLSGYGLATSLLRKGAAPDWLTWYRRRFHKTVVPFWLACLLITVCSNVVAGLLATQAHSISLLALLQNMLFLRNQYSASWDLNGAYWFMPVIIGLYAVFPWLYWFLNRFGCGLLLAATLTVQTLAILTAFNFGWQGLHDQTIFLFHLAPFVLGMCLAKLLSEERLVLDDIRRPATIVLGILCMTVSATLARGSVLGSAVNDVFTTLGLFLLGQALVPWFSSTTNPLTRMSLFAGRHSYTMFLLHLPVVLAIQSRISATTSAGNAGLNLLLGILCYAALLGLMGVLDWLIHKVRVTLMHRFGPIREQHKNPELERS